MYTVYIKNDMKKVFLINIMYTVLLLLGFNERFIYDQIYSKFREIFGKDCYKIRLADLDTMDFDINSY